jgi:ubiquinone biosynthesis protein UbiJ
MSTKPGCRTLAEYVGELIARLGAAEPAALARLREIVGGRTGRIRLDDEAIDARFDGARLDVREAGDGAVDGEGVTDRATTLDLLDGRVEVGDAILDGRLHVVGEVEDVARMFAAIEVLLEVASRAPALQALAEDYRGDPCRAPQQPPRPPATGGAAEERALLERLGLLPD